MAKNISRHITHLKSKVVESNAPKLPAAADLYEGEIAVNYAKGYETLSIKNESGTVVTFKSKDYNDGAYQAIGSYPTTSRKISTASGLTGGGDLSADRTIGLAATGTSGTYYCVKTDAYGRVTSGSSTNPNTDTAVTQTNTTTNGSYEVLLASSTATATTTEGVSKNVGMTYNPSTSALTVNKKITTIAANNFITGSGTAGSSGGTPTTYYPAKWTFNKGITVADGDMFTIKIPVAGHTYGTYLSLNNGTNYYPVVINGTTRLTTQYPVNNYITVVYETGGTATSIYPVTGGTATGTSAAGVFRVINYYDSNTTYSVVDNTYLRYNNLKAASAIYRYQILLTKDETSLLPIASVDNTTGTNKTITDSKFDPFGAIYYYNATASTAANSAIPTGRTYQQILADLRYSFNTNKALTASKSVYLVATPQADGTAILANRTVTGVSATGVISQTLPTTYDGLIYIYLGTAYSTYQLDLSLTHPVYQFSNGELRQYVGSFGNAAYLNTGTTAGTVAAGNHTHDDRYYTEAELTGSSTTVVVAKASSATTAASAAKLSNTSAIGSGTQPIFFTANGVPSATTYSLSKSVPSNAVFTDTATTLSGHYTITATTADTKSANASSTSELNWGSSVVTGVTISGDAKGHITAVSVASGNLKTPVTGVTLASGTNNGTVKLTVNGSATDNIAVKGLGTAAYKAEGYFAGSGHTHATSIATSTGTNQLTLGFGSKYSLNAGGTSYIFTMPSSASSWNSVTSVTTSSTAGNISVNGSNVAVAGLGGAAYLNTGTTAGTVAAGDHTHSAYVNQNAFSNVKLGSSTIAADSATDTLEVVSGNSFIGLTADTTNDKLTIGVNTGTTSATVARGDHSHSSYAVTSRTISTASGLTGGGNLSADRTIGLAATGSAGTYSTVVVDEYGRVTSGITMPTTYTATTYTSSTITSSEPIVYCLVKFTANLANQVCPVTNLANGQQCVVIYNNTGSTDNVTVSFGTTYLGPEGGTSNDAHTEVKLTVKKYGYGEVNFVNIGGTILLRGV